MKLAIPLSLLLLSGCVATGNTEPTEQTAKPTDANLSRAQRLAQYQAELDALEAEAHQLVSTTDFSDWVVTDYSFDPGFIENRTTEGWLKTVDVEGVKREGNRAWVRSLSKRFRASPNGKPERVAWISVREFDCQNQRTAQRYETSFRDWTLTNWRDGKRPIHLGHWGPYDPAKLENQIACGELTADQLQRGKRLAELAKTAQRSAETGSEFDRAQFRDVPMEVRIPISFMHRYELL